MPLEEGAKAGASRKKQKYLEDAELVAKAKEKVTTSFKAADDNQSSYFSKFRKYYELYRGVQTNKHYQGRANLFIPEAFTNLESIHARVIRSFQGVKVKPQGKDDVEKVEPTEQLLEYQLRVYNFKQAFKDLVKDALLYGTGVLKSSWVFTQDGKLDHPTLEAVDIGEYFFDPDATNRSDSRFEIHASYKSLSELKSNPNYDQEKLKELKDNNKGASSQDSLRNSRATTVGATTPQNKGKHFVIEYWGLFQADEKEGEREFLITVVDGETVIRFEENPYLELFDDSVVDEKMARPFIVMKDVDVPHEFYGLGMIEPIERLIEELNDTRNQRMDNVTLIVDQMYEVQDAADIDENELVARGGGIVHSAVPQGVTPIPRGDVTGSSYNEEQIIKQDIQKAIGLPDVATGSLQGAQGETAATILSLQESANIRFDVKIGQFADAVRHAMSLILAYDQKWLDRKVVVRIEGETGAEFPEIDRDAIAGKLDLDIQMDTQMNKIVRRQEAFQLYQLLAANPMINQEANTRMLLEAVDRKEIEELMTLPPPAPKPPEEPKKSISVSLKGDLNSLESDDIAVIMGAKQESADPLLRKETRELMQGIMPEKQENDLRAAELEEKVMEEERLKEDRAMEFTYKNRELDYREKELNYKIAALQQDSEAPTL